MSAMFAFILLQAATAVSAAPATPAPPADLKIVCRTLQGTGSRLNSQRVCLPKREWQRMWDNGREATSSLQDHYSKQDPTTGR
jgi:hypothetical protein